MIELHDQNNKEVYVVPHFVVAIEDSPAGENASATISLVNGVFFYVKESKEEIAKFLGDADKPEVFVNGDVRLNG